MRTFEGQARVNTNVVITSTRSFIKLFKLFSYHFPIPHAIFNLHKTSQIFESSRKICFLTEAKKKKFELYERKFWEILTTKLASTFICQSITPKPFIRISVVRGKKKSVFTILWFYYNSRLVENSWGEEMTHSMTLRKVLSQVPWTWRESANKPSSNV